ncbi:unnamed protein product [Rangifer tarandus platyrhynchus]|uniref:Uncharacterized protein n=1 Tax=Rangifer tarandus platyrhynchus TaxID=3082113 RepID=A0AC59ZL02_RANTA
MYACTTKTPPGPAGAPAHTTEEWGDWLQNWNSSQAVGRACNSSPPSFVSIRSFLSFPFSLFKYISHRQGLVIIYSQTNTHGYLKGQSETSRMLHGVFIFPFFAASHCLSPSLSVAYFSLKGAFLLEFVGSLWMRN